MAELSAAVIKRTQDTLGKQIKKPTLTEKLLRKPPFRFLHDIITSVIKTTGYFDGLYTVDELQSENIKDRDAKIAFLQKAIDVVKLCANENIKVRPAKVVAGLEADKTNEFLQAIGKAIERKIDCKEAVASVKNGVTAEPTKPAKPKTEKSKTEKSKESAPTGLLTKKSSIDGNKKTESKTKGGGKVDGKNTTENKKSKPKMTKQSSATKEDGQSKTRKSEEPKPTKQTEKAVAQPTIDEKEFEKEAIDALHRSDNIAPEKEDVAAVGKEDIAQPIIEPDPIMPTDNKEIIEKSTIAESEEKPMLAKVDSAEKSMSSNVTKIEVNSSQAETNKTPKIKSKEETKVREKRSPPLKPKHKPDEPLSNTVALTKKSIAADVTVPMHKPVTALRSAAIRPVSARPSAPRRRDRNVKQILNHDSSFMHEPIEPKNSEKKDLISEFDDGENIIITDIIQDTTTATNAVNTIDKITDGKQGHLVQQILETQTVFMNADNNNNNDAKHGGTAISTDESSINDRKSQTRNMSELRQSIQKLSLYITPLGKLMEYFQEDVDAMQIELLMWQNAYATANTDIKQEQSQTESSLEQFKYQLAEINNSIKEHTEQINNTATNIIQNEEKISKLIGTL